MINTWNLTETNLAKLEKDIPQVAVISTAAVEPHNRHLPEGMDWLHTTYIAKECCRKAHESGGAVLYLPAIPFGVDCNLMDFPIAVHVSQSTLNLMVREIIESLRHYGIRKFVLLNGHGGNDFKPFVRQIQCDSDVFVFLCNWWTVGMDQYSTIFEKPDDHAGEFETSVALALYPQLVEMENAGPGKSRPFRFEALRNGWVSTSRRFACLNDHCANGDPSYASADKGHAYLQLVIERISTFLTELSNTPIDGVFPHMPDKPQA